MSSTGSSQKRKLTPDYVDSDSDYESKQPKITTKTEEKPKKTQEEKISKTNEDAETFFELTSKRRVTVRKFKGNVLIDVREFWEDGGELKPGKKGISLTVEQWDRLKGLMEDIDGAITKIQKVGKRSLLD